MPNIHMKEARCESTNGGTIPKGTYIAGRTFGEFTRVLRDIKIKSYDQNQTAENISKSRAEPRGQTLGKRHRPHHDDRKFLMLVDASGETKFKACKPTCTDVKWNTVPSQKRIPGFGRKGTEQKTMPTDFIPKDLTRSERSFGELQDDSRQLLKNSLAIPNVTSSHVPWKKDDVSYRALMNTPLDIGFEKCISGSVRTGKGRTEEERCHSVDWTDIPIGELIADFGRKNNGLTPRDRTFSYLADGEDTVEISNAAVVTIVYSVPNSPNTKSYVAVREGWGHGVQILECDEVLDPDDTDNVGVICGPFKNKFNVGDALGWFLAIVPEGEFARPFLKAAAMAILFVVVCPLSLVMVLGVTSLAVVIPLFVLVTVRMVLKYLL